MMKDVLLDIAPLLAAGFSLIFMGICGFGLLGRLTHLLRGEEEADGLSNRRQYAPAKALAAAAFWALVSRLALYLLAYGLYRLLGMGEDSFGESFMPLWCHWDARHYLGIARDGYTAVGDERLRLVFFPLYALLMRIGAPLAGGNLFFTGTVISLLCTMGAAALLYDLAYLHTGRRGARLAEAYFLLNPMSVFLGCVYTEALFLLLTLGAFCLWRRGHPWAAALCGMLSALTRMPGVIAAGIPLIALLGRIPKKTCTPKAVFSCLGQMLVVFAGLFLYWGINYAVTGDPLMYLTYQRENWFQQAGSFWQSTANTMAYFILTVGEGDWLWTWGFQLLCMGYIYALLAFRQKRLPFDLAAYSFVYVAVVLSPTWLLSGPRYLYALCVLPILQAQAHKGRHMHALALGLSGLLLLVFTFGYTISVTVL